MSHYQIDPSHSTLEFSVRHLVISRVKGRFDRWNGEVVLDDEDPTRSRVSLVIEAASIDTRDEKRDAHLRSADFFDVETHPELRFTSRRVERAGDGRYRVIGDLTLRGVTREIAVDVEEGGRAKDPWGGSRVGFSARASLDRKEYGLAWNMALEAGGVLVGDRVDISAEIEAVLAASQAAA